MDCQLLFQVVQILSEMLVSLLQVVDRPARMKNSRVIFSSAVQTNIRQRTLGHFLGEVHRDLSGLDDFSFARF